MGCFLCVLFWIAVPIIIIKLYLKLSTGWCRSNVNLVGKTTIITGANTGVGYETAADFAQRGAKVILACRDPGRGQDAQRRLIRDTDNPNIIYKHLDLASPKSISDFAEDINKTEKRIDILVNNAGVGAVGPNRTAENGLHLLMQINHFGPFFLTNLLLDLIRKTPNSRIVNVSSMGAKFVKGLLDIYDLNKPTPTSFKEWDAYGRSKLCNILFTIELATSLKDTSVTTYSVHPGGVLTDIFNTMPTYMKVIRALTSWLWKDCQEGAQTTIYCAVEKGIEDLSGENFEDCRVVKRYKPARYPDLPKKLWEVSEELVGLKKQK